MWSFLSFFVSFFLSVFRSFFLSLKPNYLCFVLFCFFLFFISFIRSVFVSFLIYIFLLFFVCFFLSFVRGAKNQEPLKARTCRKSARGEPNQGGANPLQKKNMARDRSFIKRSSHSGSRGQAQEGGGSKQSLCIPRCVFQMANAWSSPPYPSMGSAVGGYVTQQKHAMMTFHSQLLPQGFLVLDLLPGWQNGLAPWIRSHNT